MDIPMGTEPKDYIYISIERNYKLYLPFFALSVSSTWANGGFLILFTLSMPDTLLQAIQIFPGQEELDLLSETLIIKPEDQ